MDSITALAAMDAEEMTAKFRFIIDGMLNNRAMVVTIAAFAITIFLVYLIRRLSVDYSVAYVDQQIVGHRSACCRYRRHRRRQRRCSLRTMSTIIM